ncbi:MAG: glycosyltransferase [Dechloromonas sp.]|uniref:Glycosyltransferase n=1 Tax=Candidatus Dechloromonas phosphorivorans TaxID=2899244 RepID=A0A935MZ73_9RHOO|nr:glycosyltransferase [Candidatus Dechloromonas phosphorivorans]
MPSIPPIKVSIIIRSMGRACLREALLSVANAAFAPLEVILVNARGGHHDEPSHSDERLRFRLVNQGGAALERAPAANSGLLESTGEFVQFLDDDDLVDVDHLARLVACLSAHPDAIAAYTGVRLLDAQGNALRELNEAWEPERLLGMNFLPIHAVMFRGERVRRHLSFDPSLRLMEDWDFWRQLAMLGDFVRLPGCSATYRLQHGESGLSGWRDKQAMYFAHSLVLDKIRLVDATGVSRALFWFDTALNHVQGEKEALATDLKSANSYVVALEQRVRLEEATSIHFRHANEVLVSERNAALVEVDKMRCAHDDIAIKLAATQSDITAAASNGLRPKLGTTKMNCDAKKGDIDELVTTRNEDTNEAISRRALALVLESTSWKITAPFRRLVTKIRHRGNADD